MEDKGEILDWKCEKGLMHMESEKSNYNKME